MWLASLVLRNHTYPGFGQDCAKPDLYPLRSGTIGKRGRTYDAGRTLRFRLVWKNDSDAYKRANVGLLVLKGTGDLTPDTRVQVTIQTALAAVPPEWRGRATHPPPPTRGQPTTRPA